MPFVVALYDPGSHTVIKKYVFLGNVSQKVLQAAKKQNASVLSKHYGAQWKKVLGGNEDEFGDLDVLNNLDVTSFIKEEELKQETRKAEAQASALQDTGTGTEFSTIAVYPEDNIYNLRDKIYVATGIPLFRQHLFWNLKRPRVPYNLKVQGREQEIVIDNYMVQGDGLVAGMPIDNNLADEYTRGNVTVNSMDAFTRVDDIDTVYLVDFARVIADNITMLKDAVRDPVQLELLYNGFVVKYWPQMSPESLMEYIETGKISYPRLLPKLPATRESVELSNQISAQVHGKEGYNDDKHVILSATLHVDGHQQINPRYLFDLVALDTQIVAAVVRFMADSNAGERSVDMSVVKRDQSAYGRDDTAAIDRQLVKPLPANSCRFVLRVFEDRKKGRAVLVIINILKNGNYSVEGTWSENLGINVDNIRQQMIRVISPVLNKIEKLPVLGTLEKPTKANSRLENMTIALYWPHAMNDRAFKEARSRLIQYEKAGFLVTQNLQKQGGLELRFLRGVVDYNPCSIEQVVLITGDGAEFESRISNTYAHLTNDQVSQRWNYIYSGRLVRVHHRTINIKIDMQGMSEREFEIARRYVVNIFDTMRREKSPGILRPQDITVGPKTTTLKYLQDRDPELYDLRKHDANATVYSVLCQNPRPPMMYNADEKKLLPAKVQEKLVPYWNYTTDEPAWYYCPNRKFSHLSFLEGRHPLGYCLPCCQKTSAFPGSRRDVINTACTAQDGRKPEPIDDEFVSETSHILSYGKRIPTGRYSQGPPLLVNGFLFDTLPKNHVYYLEGVDQGRSGLFHSISQVLGIDGVDLATRLVKYVHEAQVKYTDLPTDELADDLLKFYTMPGTLTSFSPGGKACRESKRILLELVLSAFNLVVVEYHDEKLNVFDQAATRIRHTDFQGMCVVVDLPTDKQTRGGVYPLISIGPEGVATKIIQPHHPAVKIIQKFLESELGRIQQMDLKQCEHMFITPKHDVLQLVNQTGLCYGVLVDKAVYLPVIESEISDKYPVHNGPRPDVELPQDKLHRLVKGKVKPTYMLRLKDKYVGFISTEDLYYYHDPTTKPFAAKIPVLDIPYDPREVDLAITTTDIGMLPEYQQESDESMYELYVYHMILVQLGGLLEKERNAKLRKFILQGADVALDPSDELKLDSIRQRALRKKVSLEKELEKEVFIFDQITLNKWRKLSLKEVVTELKRLLEGQIQIVKQRPTDFDNIITPNNTIKVHTDSYNDLMEVLAGDILNPRKKESIIITSRLVDNFTFEPRDNERLEILVTPWM